MFKHSKTNINISYLLKDIIYHSKNDNISKCNVLNE